MIIMPELLHVSQLLNAIMEQSLHRTVVTKGLLQNLYNFKRCTLQVHILHAKDHGWLTDTNGQLTLLPAGILALQNGEYDFDLTESLKNEVTRLTEENKQLRKDIEALRNPPPPESAFLEDLLKLLRVLEPVVCLEYQKPPPELAFLTSSLLDFAVGKGFVHVQGRVMRIAGAGEQFLKNAESQ